MLGLLSLAWPIGLVLYLINFKSKSVVRRYQAKNLLICAACGFILMLLVIVGSGTEEKKSNIKEIGQVKVEETKKDTRPTTQSNYTSDREIAKSTEDCINSAFKSVVGKTFTAMPDQRSKRTAVGLVTGVKFHDSPELGPGFNVKDLEKFTVVRHIEKEKSKILSFRSDWYEVKFESGKIGYVHAEDFYCLSDGPDVYQEAEDCYKNTQQSK